MLGINELKEGRNFILKRFVKIEDEEIADREKASKKYLELDEEEDSNREDEAPISLEF